MATTSILGGFLSPEEVSAKDIHALGPSDNSDSGSDATGAYSEDELASDTDSSGTGERASVESNHAQTDADILPSYSHQLKSENAREESETPAENRWVSNDVEELMSDADDATLGQGSEDKPAGQA